MAKARRVTRRAVGWAVGVFLLLAVVHTWPLITGLNHLSSENDDAWLNAWAISWVAHQLPRDPLHLLDANMYHPEPQAFAKTEPLIIPGLMGAPLRWVGASPVLTYNILVLLGFTLTALAMYALVVSWTGDHWAGLLAGALLAFSAPMLTRLPHLQALHFYWLPLAVLALDRLLTRPRTRDAVWVGVCVLGAALTSGYLVVFVTFALGAAFIARARHWWGPEGVGIFIRLGAAAVITLLLLLVILGPYGQARRTEPPADTDSMSTALESYLTSTARVHYTTWSHVFYERAPAPLFPGLTALVLAGVALRKGRAVMPRGARRMLIGIGMVGFVFSLGALTPIYVWAYHLVPPLQGLRAPSRFGVLVLFALTALAGCGLAAIRRHLSARWRTVVPVVFLIVATMENLHAPMPYGDVEWSRPIYRSLAAVAPGAVLELPIYASGSFHQNAWYLLASTTHWRPLVNGFGGYQSVEYVERAGVVGTFPSVVANARLRVLRVPYVVIHLDAYSERADAIQALERAVRRGEIDLVAKEGSDRLYRIRPAIPTRVSALLNGLAWSEVTLRWPGPDTTLRQAVSLGATFALRSSDQFVVYMEDTTPNSRLVLDVPVPMTGEFLDAGSGAVLKAVSLRNAQNGSPAVVTVPPGREAVMLALRAR